MTVERSDPLRLVRKSTEDSEVKLNTSWELQKDGSLLVVSQYTAALSNFYYVHVSFL